MNNMTGTGTQNDPYIISSADDLYAMKTVGGNGVYCELGADIDFNGTPYAEHFETIPINCAYFDGKGHTIRNIYIQQLTGSAKLFAVSQQTSLKVYVSGLKLENIDVAAENIYIFNNVVTTGSAQRISFYNCSFAFRLRRNNSSTGADYSFICGNYINPDFELCSIALDIIAGSSMPLIKNGTLKRSHIDLQMKVRNAASGAQTHLLYSTAVTDSYITGKIESLSEPITNFYISDASSKYINFYSVLEFDELTNIYWDGIFNRACFYDKEVAENRTFSRASSSTLYEYYGLTTAQCKDPAYLMALGFIVEGTE